MIRNVWSCFIPLFMEQMLLCAASAVFYENPATGVLIGHILTAVMCVFILREDGDKLLREEELPREDELRREGAPRREVELRREDALRQVNPSKHKTKRSIGVAETVLWMAAACALCILSTYVLNAAGVTEMDEAYIGANAVIEEASPMIRFLTVIIAAPFSEELLYRGALYRRVSNFYGEKAGILVSTAAFALSHGNITQALAACGSGLLFVTAYRRTGARTGTLWLPMLLHSLFNACSMYLVAVM